MHSSTLFEEVLNKEISVLGKRWKAKANNVFCLSRLVGFDQLKPHAQKLLDSAYLYREATRKIIKKYNKRSDSTILNNFNFEFQKLYTIKRLQGICGTLVDKECCICYDPLFCVYSQSCGHLVCGSCFEQQQKQKIQLCPICRNSEKWSRFPECHRTVEHETRRRQFLSQKHEKKLRQIPIIQLLNGS